MELRQLKTFLTVAELLSFNKAATVLNLAQSTVSARIRVLEDDLGVLLFDRLGKNVTLTEAGRKMARYARKMIDMEAETLAEVGRSEEPGGSLSVRIPQSLGALLLPEVLKRFQQTCPRVNLDINSCSFNLLKKELRSGITDVAFLFIDGIHEVDLVEEVLGFTEILFVYSAMSPLAETEIIELESMENQCLLLPKFDCHYNKTFLQTLKERNIQPAAVIELNSIETIKCCVEQGVGVGVLPEIVVEKDVEGGRFVASRVGANRVETAILMIRHKNKWLSPSLENFINTVKNCF